MGTKPFNPWFALPVVLALPVIISAQSAPHPQTLVVNGQAGKTTVVQVNGRSYVDVEALAQIANGTVAFKDNQITLTVPSSASGSGTTGQTSPPASHRCRRLVSPADGSWRSPTDSVWSAC